MNKRLDAKLDSQGEHDDADHIPSTSDTTLDILIH